MLLSTRGRDRVIVFRVNLVIRGCDCIKVSELANALVAYERRRRFSHFGYVKTAYNFFWRRPAANIATLPFF